MGIRWLIEMVLRDIHVKRLRMLFALPLQLQMILETTMTKEIAVYHVI